MSLKRSTFRLTEYDTDKFLSQVESRLRADGFERLFDEKLVLFLVDVLGASVDLITYYIERRAEEQFLGTAKLETSVYANAIGKGYPISRMSPATARVTLTIAGGDKWANVPVGTEVVFNAQTTRLSYNGFPFVLSRTYIYRIRPNDVTNLTNKDYRIRLTYAVPTTDGILELVPDGDSRAMAPDRVAVTMVQGEFRSFTIDPSSNPYLDEPFQTYYLGDTEASNIFGTEDFGYNASLGESNLRANFFSVSVAPSGTPPFHPSYLYKVERESLLSPSVLYRDNWDTIATDQGIEESMLPKACLVRTTADKGLQIQFADGLIARKPKSGEVIAIRYFATKGRTANLGGLRGKPVNFESTIAISGASTSAQFFGELSNADISVAFTSSISGGTDFESMDSVRFNAPQWESSNGRLVTRGDYSQFIKELPNMQHGFAWGEQEEAERSGVKAIPSLSNVVLFTAIGPLYAKDHRNNSYPLLSVDEAGYAGGSSIEEQCFVEGLANTPAESNYANFAYAKVMSADLFLDMKRKENAMFSQFVNTNTQVDAEILASVDLWKDRIYSGHPIANVMDKMEARSMLTLKHQYITPIVQSFAIVGDIIISEFADRTEVMTRVNDLVYAYSKQNIGFNSPVMISQIVDIIKSDIDVKSCNIRFVPVEPSGEKVTSWYDDKAFNWPVNAQNFNKVNSVEAPYINPNTSYGFTAVVDKNASGFYDADGRYSSVTQLYGKPVRVIRTKTNATTGIVETDTYYGRVIGNLASPVGDTTPRMTFKATGNGSLSGLMTHPVSMSSTDVFFQTITQDSLVRFGGVQLPKSSSIDKRLYRCSYSASYPLTTNLAKLDMSIVNNAYAKVPRVGGGFRYYKFSLATNPSESTWQYASSVTTDPTDAYIVDVDKVLTSDTILTEIPVEGLRYIYTGYPARIDTSLKSKFFGDLRASDAVCGGIMVPSRHKLELVERTMLVKDATYLLDYGTSTKSVTWSGSAFKQSATTSQTKFRLPMRVDSFAGINPYSDASEYEWSISVIESFSNVSSTSSIDGTTAVSFCPKTYLIDAFVNLFEGELQKLFEVFVAKECGDCPEHFDGYTESVVYAKALEDCKPLQLQYTLNEVDGAVDSTKCYPSDSLKVVTWDEYYKARYWREYQGFTRCNKLSLLTQDEMYQGKYSDSLDISEFSSIVLPRQVFKPYLPARADFGGDWVTEVKMHHRISGISERWFMQTIIRGYIMELMRIVNRKHDNVSDDFLDVGKNILDIFLREFGHDGYSFDVTRIRMDVMALLAKRARLEDLDAESNAIAWLSSNAFLDLVQRLRNTLKVAIKSGMLDKHGNIVNFTMGTEIVALRCRMDYRV